MHCTLHNIAAIVIALLNVNEPQPPATQQASNMTDTKKNMKSKIA
jgi:hypothetical protein